MRYQGITYSLTYIYFYVRISHFLYDRVYITYVFVCEQIKGRCAITLRVIFSATSAEML